MDLYFMRQEYMRLLAVNMIGLFVLQLSISIITTLCISHSISPSLYYTAMFLVFVAVGLNFDDKWYTDIAADSIGVFYMTFLSYFQTLWVLRKCQLKGSKPIKVSLTEHTKEKYKITFARQVTRDIFIRMSSKEPETAPGDAGDLDHCDSNSSAPSSPRKRDHFGKMGKLYFNIINEESGFSLFCLHLTKEWSIENMVGFIEFAQLFRVLLAYKPS